MEELEDLKIDDEEIIEEPKYPEELEEENNEQPNEEVQENIESEVEDNKPTLSTYELAIKGYLDSIEDEAFKEKYKGSDEEIKDCFTFIKGEARKQAINGCAMIEDSQVYQWARHYFDDVREEELKNKAESEKKRKEREEKAASKKKNSKPKNDTPTEDIEESDEESEDELVGGIFDFD